MVVVTEDGSGRWWWWSMIFSSEQWRRWRATTIVSGESGWSTGEILSLRKFLNG